MSKKVKKILAYIALVFMGIFSVTFVLFLVDPKMGGGVVAFITLFSGVIGIGLFFLIKIHSKKEEGNLIEVPDNDGEDEPDENDGSESEPAEAVNTDEAGENSRSEKQNNK